MEFAIMSPQTSGRTKRNHWKNLQRDANGRWVKQSAKVKAKISASMPPKASRSTPLSPASVANALASVKHDFDKNCPRCSGDMKIQSVRCGPERLIKVKKCEICNFWLPLQA